MSAIICKFENIILREESEIILKEYNNLNILLSSKPDEAKLKENEYEQIFQFNKSDINKIQCYLEKTSEFFLIHFYYDLNNDMKRKNIYLKREPYNFNFNGNDYIGFEKLALFRFLSDEYKKKKFVIIYKSKAFNSVTNFIDYGISRFEIKYDYKHREIIPDKLQPQNVYIKKNIYNAEDINYEFPYYINLEEIDFNNFQYFETESRKDFFRKIEEYIDTHFYVAICGPYGSGKTVTILKLIMNDETRRFFYINLWTISTNNLDELKEILIYECVKLFKKNIFELNKKKELSSEEKNMKDILNCINNFKDQKEIFKLILNIISLLKNIKEIFIIVIDQYSSKYDNNNNNIQKIISYIKNSNIKLFVCSSMNNEDVKNNLSKSFAFNKELNFLSYIYVGPLIRFNFKDIKNESLSFKKILSELGNLFIYYYLLKENERKNNNLNEFLNQEKKNIQKEIAKFYYHENEFIDRNKMTKDIIDIIYFINEKKVFFYEDLEDLILKLPLKFLEIKRQEISIFELKKYALRTQNMDLHKKIEELNNEKIETTYISQEKTFFFKNENVIPKPYKRKLNYNDLISSSKESNKIKIYIYFLDYLFPYVQDILTNIIYNETMKMGQLFFTNLDGQLQGGFLEYFIIEYIKDKKHFFEYKIDGFESIETIVEKWYFIQNHSSRKHETKRYYEEKENIDNTKKKQTKIQLPKNIILITQKEFTGKYYDCAFLFPVTKDEKDIKFRLAVCQISKKKIASQRYYKEEHELILGNVKKNIENKFDVKISGGYFFYIFSSQELDKSSIEFCKEYDFEFVLFSPDKMEFDYSFTFNLDHSFITNNFPTQNSFSILPPEKFETNNKNKLVCYDEIKNIQKNIINIKISKENEIILNKCFGVNEYFVLGYFKQKFKITKFCLWYDKNKKEIYYHNLLKEIIVPAKLIFDNKENSDNFVLIGLKDEILYSGNHSILEYFSPK